MEPPLQPRVIKTQWYGHTGGAMWDFVERLSTLAGIAGFVVALVGAPAFIKAIRVSGQWFMWLWSWALFTLGALLIFRYAPASQLVLDTSSSIARGLEGLGLATPTAWSWCFALLGALLGLAIAPLKWAGLTTEAKIALFAPITKSIIAKSHNKKNAALQMQQLQKEFSFNPLLSVLSYVGSAMICVSAFGWMMSFDFSIYQQFLPDVSIPITQWLLLATIICLRITYVAVWRSVAHPNRSAFGGYPNHVASYIILLAVIDSLGDSRPLLAIFGYYMTLIIVLLFKSDGYSLKGVYARALIRFPV